MGSRYSAGAYVAAEVGMVNIRVAVAKTGCAPAVMSGDTLEFIERPGGGFSFVLVAGDGTGTGAKTLSNLLATRAIALLKDGARDATVARTVHDYLYTYRMSQAAATLNILSVDFATGMIRMVRNNPAPFFVLKLHGMQVHHEEAAPIGLYAATEPVVTELPVEPYTYLIMFTAGLLRAGAQHNADMAISNYLAGWPVSEAHDPAMLTESLLARALEAEQGQPGDAISIVTLAVLPSYPPGEEEDTTYPVRRLSVSFPFERT
jgi:serine phosphatase RsbU (regulator of sigma subunit)